MAGASITLAAGTAISTAAAVAIGTSISFVTGAIGGAIMDIGNQYFNTGTIDWGSVGISALEYGLINVLCAFTGAIIDGLNIAFVGEMVKGIKAIRNVVAVTSATGIIGSLIDVLRNMWNNRLVK